MRIIDVQDADRMPSSLEVGFKTVCLLVTGIENFEIGQGLGPVIVELLIVPFKALEKPTSKLFIRTTDVLGSFLKSIPAFVS